MDPGNGISWRHPNVTQWAVPGARRRVPAAYAIGNDGEVIKAGHPMAMFFWRDL
jgi:hypothetical protein